MKVDKHTRAGKNGKVIVCPCGENSIRVYHFAWSAVMCPCGKMIEKEHWEIETFETKRNERHHSIV